MLLVFLFFISYSHLSFSLSPHFTLFIFRVSSSICSTTERHLRSFNLQSIRLFLIIYKMFFFRFLLFFIQSFYNKIHADITNILRLFGIIFLLLRHVLQQIYKIECNHVAYRVQLHCMCVFECVSVSVLALYKSN